MARVDADLEYPLNSALSIGPWPVRVSADNTRAQLADLDGLEDLREIHGWGPMFTLRLADGATRDVVIGRPDDDGTFALVDPAAAAALEVAATAGHGPLPEPAHVASTTRWLHEHGFVTREHSRGGTPSGSRLFQRDDDWRVRYSCVLDTWSLELSPPAHHRFTSLRLDENTTWLDAVSTLVRPGSRSPLPGRISAGPLPPRGYDTAMLVMYPSYPHHTHGVPGDHHAD